MTPTVVTVCSTCTDTSRAGEEGIGGGQRLVGEVEALAASEPEAPVVVRSTRCLMACTEGCAVAVAATDKMHYLLGRWSGDAASAREVLAFARQHADSATGVVPNAEWSPILALHFLARIPPPGIDVAVTWGDEGCDL